jgi:hypothetical protein
MQVSPYPVDAGTWRKTVTTRNTDAEDGVQKEADESITATQGETKEAPRASQECHDTTALPFSEWRRRPVADDQFGKFVEVTKKLYINIPLLGAM